MKKNDQSIIGTWEMVEAWDIGDNPATPHKKTYPWGNPSSGYWVYDRSGHFSLMISQNPALPIPQVFPETYSPEWLSASAPWTVPHELLMDTFGPKSNPYAYFGTYTVQMDPKNPGSGNILHTVVADVMRAYTNTVQTRPFSFDGDDYLNVGVAGQYLRRLKRLT